MPREISLADCSSGRSQANETRVPTVLGYSRETGEMTSWGYASESRSEQASPDVEIVDRFKFCLDETFLQSLQGRDPNNTPASIEEVEKWFLNYLSQLYKHLEFVFSKELLPNRTWANSHVDFLFSIPSV